MYRLVVIDDEYIVVQGIKALISRLKLDYEVVGAAYDGIQGLEVIRSEKPDVVITDIRIPGLDGLSVIEAAKEDCPDTYFIVISGYSEFVYAQRALTLGVKDYIDKPVTADKLKNALTRIEDEWAKTRHEDNRKAQANREKFQELERIFESSVKCITNCDAAAFREECRQAIRCLQELYPELQSIEEVQAYGKSVLSDISKHLTADQTGSKHRVILELLTYLDEHYDQDIGLSELADRAGMSTAYLSVLFKTEVGTSYVKYLTDLRIKKAKKLLQDGYKVNEVSEMVGYNNYRYFCDIFKKHEGMTPNEYKGNVWKAEG